MLFPFCSFYYFASFFITIFSFIKRAKTRKYQADSSCIHRTFYRFNFAFAKVFIRVTDTCIHTSHVFN